jgi:uncharacterized lipoprotein YmbA
MRKQILGWAVIFAVTLLLSACASHEAQVSHYNKMSGADATMAQTEEQELALALASMDDTFLYSVATLENSSFQGEWLTAQDDTFTYSPPLTVESAFTLDQREMDLEWRQDALAETKAFLDERERRLDQREVDLEFQQDAVAVMISYLGERDEQLAQRESLATGTEQFAETDSMPANAEPGQCYAQVTVPGEFLTVTDKVLIKPAGEKIEIIPARYETVSKEVLVDRGSAHLKTIPAEYRTVTEKVMVAPASKYLVHVPAQYEVTLEQVMVTPATRTWKQGTGPIQRVDETTGEILCLVETPAQYQTISKRVLKAPATTREVENPAVFETIKRQELVTPAKTVMVDIPAKYKTVQVTKMISPEYQRTTPIPAQYQTVTKRIKVTEDRVAWEEILCETNMTQSKVSDIQRALAHAGFSPGPIDGIVGKQTMAAVNDFQRANNLTVAKYLTVDTIVALGLRL